MKNKKKTSKENSEFERNTNPDVLTSMQMFRERAKLSKEKVVELDEIFKGKLMATPELGKDILNFIVNLSDQNQKIHDKVISVHQSTIDQLFKRLDKEDITEKEIEKIYDELRFLIELVDKARKEWKDTLEKVLIGGSILVTGAIGTYVAAKLNDEKEK